MHGFSQTSNPPQVEHEISFGSRPSNKVFWSHVFLLLFGFGTTVFCTIKILNHQEDFSGHHTGECALPRHHASALPVVVSSPTDSTVCGVQLRNHLDLSYLGDGSRTPRSDSCWDVACALSRGHHMTARRDTDIFITVIPLPCVPPFPTVTRNSSILLTCIGTLTTKRVWRSCLALQPLPRATVSRTTVRRS